MESVSNYSKERFNSFSDEVKAANVFRQNNLRKILTDDVEGFLASGGQITVIPAPEYKNRQPSKKVSPYPSVKPKDKRVFYDHKYNVALREWCRAVDGRAKALSDATGYCKEWISKRCNGVYQFKFVEYEHVWPHVLNIELQEKKDQLHKITQKYLGESNESETNEKI